MDYEQWLSNTFQMIQDKTVVLQKQRNMTKQENHPRITAKDRKQTCEAVWRDEA